MMKTYIDPKLVLRMGGGICFIGHGLLALTGKTGFVGLLGTFGLEAGEALLLLKVIGLVDVAVGLSILFRPRKRVLQWAFLWTCMTVVAWGIHGDNLMDLARRAPYFTTPLALLFLLYKSKQRSSIADPNAEHSQLSGDWEKAIKQLDLSMICMKLMDSDEGEGWSQRQCGEVSLEYRRFLALHVLYPDEPIVPTRAVDACWHRHILDTAAYQRDCEAIFGRLLHHYPYFGMQGAEDERQFVSAFDRTKQLYKLTFGRAMDGPDYLPSFQIRQSA